MSDQQIRVTEFKRVVVDGLVDVIRPGDAIDPGRAKKFGLKTAVKAEKPKTAAKPTASEPPAGGDDGEEYPTHVGGGYYELSDGSRVQGKDAAEAAQAEIDAEPAGDGQEE